MADVDASEHEPVGGDAPSDVLGRLVLRSFAMFGGAASVADAAQPSVRTELERRARETLHFSALASFPTAVLFGAVLWSRSPTFGLVIWILATSCNAALWLVHLRRPICHGWNRTAQRLQLSGGLAWALLPAIAMPSSPDWQIYVAALSLGVQAANVLFSSPIRGLFYRFHLPHTLLTVFGFALNATGSGSWGLPLVGYSALFAVALAEISHATALSASVFAVRSADLATGLASKTQALGAANRQLAVQARTDALTGLSNRIDFADRLEEALAPSNDHVEGTVVGVAYVDLDGFKAVNDGLGHRIGDLLLVAVAARLRRCLHDAEVLARQGGDELVVLSPALDQVGGLAELGRRLRSSFDEPFMVDSRRIEIGATVGLADSTRTHDAGELLRFADAALYQGKANGGRRVEVFDAEMQAALGEKRQVEDEILAAFDGGSFVPYLQPLVELATGRIVGAEALVRWVRADEVRTAATFLGPAADLGVLEALTRRLVADVGDYRMGSAESQRADLQITANVAPHHLGALIDHFEDTAVLSGLTIEVTEDAAFVSSERGNELIERARRLGARIYLDDFGAGFSSLAWAMELNVDGYKIDRAFVSGIVERADARAVVAGMVEMARQQGRAVVVEGVETPAQASVLSDLGVAVAQGFLFAPAVPIETFDGWLATDRRFDVASAPGVASG